MVRAEAVQEARQVDGGAEGDQRVGVGLAAEEVEPELQAVRPPVDRAADGEGEGVRVLVAPVVLGADVPEQVLVGESALTGRQARDAVGRAVQQVEAHQVDRMGLVGRPAEEPVGEGVAHGAPPQKLRTMNQMAVPVTARPPPIVTVRPRPSWTYSARRLPVNAINGVPMTSRAMPITW
ncbi:hypothetical protein GCM10020229_26650 [Kitasatospora albolonga]